MTASDPGRPGRRLLALLCAVAFLDFVDASITNVALPHIRAALHFSSQSLQWVPSAYLLTYGGFMLLGGRLADLLGRRRMLVVGASLIALASLTGGLAGDAGVFVGARLVQGLGAALTLPAALSLLTTTFTEPRERQAALGVWGATAGLASAVGILLGGVLTDGPGWRWVMFVNPIACAVIIPLALALLPGDRPAVRGSRFDLPGSVVLTGAMLLLVFGIVQAPTQGWGSASTWSELAGAAVLLAVFAGVERRSADPIVPFDVVRVPGLVAADLTGLIGFAGMLSMFYFLTLYMQNVLGYSPLRSGLAYLPLTVAVGVSSGIADKALARFGTRAVVCAGALVAAAGLFLLGHVPVGGGYGTHILPGLLLVAFGLGPVFVGVTAAANAGVAPDRAGLAAALLNSAQQVGGALGLAIFSAIGAARTSHLLAGGTGARAAYTGGYRDALLAGAAFAAAAALVALLGTDTRGARPAPTTAERAPRVLVIGRTRSVLDGILDLLDRAGYAADATNEFDRVLDGFDVGSYDVVVFGGAVPPDTKELLRRAIADRNPATIFVQGLAGIAGLVAAQVQAAADPRDTTVDLGYDAVSRTVTLRLDRAGQADVTAWWLTSTTPPAPTSTSLTIAHAALAAGTHAVELPDAVPASAFVTARAGRAVAVFAVGQPPAAPAVPDVSERQLS